MTQSNPLPENLFSENEIITLAISDAYGDINFLLENLIAMQQTNKDKKEHGYSVTYQEHYEKGLQTILTTLKENFHHYVHQAEEILTSKC